MTAWAALLLFVGGITVLRDDVNTIPAGEWRYDRFSVGPQLPAEIECSFKIDEPGKARVELVTRENLQALLKHQDYETIATSTNGTLQQEIGVPGEFALVIFNLSSSKAARVAAKISLDTTGKSLVKARYLSPERKLVVILSSFAGFLLIVSLSARQLMKAMKPRQP